MKRKNDVPNNNETAEAALLDELFPSSDDGQLIDIDELHYAAFAQLISYAAALGSMVTFYGRPGDYSIGISVRVAKRKRSVVYDGEDQTYQDLVRFIDGLKRLYLHRLSGKIVSDEMKKPLPQGKRKK